MIGDSSLDVDSRWMLETEAETLLHPRGLGDFLMLEDRVGLE